MSRPHRPWQSCRWNKSDVYAVSGASPIGLEDSTAESLNPEFFQKVQIGAGRTWPSLPERLHFWARSRPDEVAFKTWYSQGLGQKAQEVSLTWSQLGARLKATNLPYHSEDPRPVALALQNSGLAPLHILEVWCSDRCLIPLSVTESEGRVSEILKCLPEDIDRRYSVDVSRQELAIPWQRLGFAPISNGDESVSVTSKGSTSLSQEREESEARIQAGSLHRWMNAVLTSGSTGFSKLVPQTRSQVLANAESLARRLNLQAGDRILTPLPLYHVNALNFSLLTSAMIGAEVHFTHALPIRSLLATIAEVRPRFVSLIPPLIRQLQSCPTEELKFAFRDTEALISAATALSPDLYEHFVRDLGIRILQGYGLSESVNFSCLMPPAFMHSIEDLTAQIGLAGTSTRDVQKFVSIGPALDGTEVSVRDADDRPLPEGSVGEICVRGFSVMDGYWSVASEDQPFVGSWMRTGDLGIKKTLADGQSIFFHVGRIKEVMKRSGETISLIEVDFKINQALTDGLGQLTRQHFDNLGISDFMATGFSHEITGEELALVVRVDPRRIRELGRSTWLEQTQNSLRTVIHGLSEKFRPRVFLFVDEEIRTASGKPQRWKWRAELAQVRNVIMTSEAKVIWNSSLSGEP